MGFFKWLSRAGSVGGTVRWAAQVYKALRAQHPNRTETTDMDIFRLMIDVPMSILPNPNHRAFLEGWMHRDIGLRSLVRAIIMAENNIHDPFSFPATFTEVIDEELAKSGLPSLVIDGPSDFPR